MSELTASDVLAMNNSRNDGLFGENGTWFIVLILFFLGGMGGGFWGNNGTSQIAAQGALTRAELYDGLNTQDIKNSINSIGMELNNGISSVKDSLNCGFAGVQLGMNNGFAGIQLGMNNGFAGIQLGMNAGFNGIQSKLCDGFNGIQSAIADSRYAMQNCCCELKTAIHSEGEQTRALMQQNLIQDLRDKIADKDREIMSTGLVTAQTIQTNNLENFFRSLVGGCGCNG